MNDMGAFLAASLALADRLETAAHRYDARSDDHEVLGYEAAIIREKAAAISERRLPRRDLSESTLLSPWGRLTVSKEREIAEAVVRFHRDCTKYQNA